MIIMEGVLEERPGVQREKMGRGVRAVFSQHWSGEHQAAENVKLKDRQAQVPAGVLSSDLPDFKDFLGRFEPAFNGVGHVPQSSFYTQK